MPGFFNTQDRLAGTLQVTNALLLAYAACDLYTNPRFELLPGMASYVFNIFSLSSDNHRQQFAAAAISGTRSAVNLGISIVDLSPSGVVLAAHHLATAIGLLAADSTLDAKQDSKPKAI